MSRSSSVVVGGAAGAPALNDHEVEIEGSRARGIVLYLEDGGQFGPCITERLALAQRDVGLLVAPVIAARPGGEDEPGANPDALAHCDRLAEALIETADHVVATAAGRGLPLVVIAEGVAAAAALRAAARCPTSFAAIVLVDGRMDLADAVLDAVRAPVLLLVDSREPALVALNRVTLAALHPAARMMVLPPCERSFAEGDRCAVVLHAMRGWLATVPALDGRRVSNWTPRDVIRVARARIRRMVTAAAHEPDTGKATRSLRPAL